MSRCNLFYSQSAILVPKIDRSLIEGMLADRGTCDTVELIIMLAHKLRLKVIAEGFETLKQFQQLHELGCDLGQGYFFSKPVEAKEAEVVVCQSASLLRANAVRV